MDVARIKKRCEGVQQKGFIPYILITTGSYNPIHIAHIQAMLAAKETLEATGKGLVVCGFLSPSHDIYVARKTGHDHIAISDRVALCNLACKESGHSSWLFVDEWESSQPQSLDYQDVVLHLDAMLNEAGIETVTKRFNTSAAPAESFDDDEAEAIAAKRSQPAQVVYVCGSDLWPLPFSGIVVVCVARSNHEEASEVRKYCRTYGVVYAVLESGAANHVSSTLLRARLHAGQSLEGLTYHSVELEIRKRRLLGTTE